MKILYVTATVAEAEAFKNVRNLVTDGNRFRSGSLEIDLLIGGIGPVSTIYEMLKWINMNGSPDLAINGGIAGSFTEVLSNGDVVLPVSECFADLGIEDHDEFITLSEAKLTNADEFPFVKGYLPGDEKIISRINSLKRVKSITVNTATGSGASIERLKRKYNPDIETMEGASFFYLCRRERIPFLALRAISNRIEPRGP
jgi:futalosine hydrolase